jgi:hypothetical protein
MREKKCFNSLTNSREERILEGKIGIIKKFPKKFLNILRMIMKLRKKFGKRNISAKNPKKIMVSVGSIGN